MEVVEIQDKPVSWQKPDQVLLDIVDYVHDYTNPSEEALQTAKLCLLDSLGCAIRATEDARCRRYLGALPGTQIEAGVKIPGTQYQLDPIKAAFDIGTCIRWLDFNDTWLAAEWGHPSDNLGAILAVTAYLNQAENLSHSAAINQQNFTIQDVLLTMIKAYEIQGVLALNHAFNREGLDHVALVKVASTAVSSFLLGGTKEHTLSAVANAWVDGQSLRTYRHAPNTGPRKSWAAGDATSRAVRLAMLAVYCGEPGYPQGLTTPTWGAQDSLFKGKSIELAQSLGCYVMENILFKVRYPAEFHAQTAVEAAIKLHQSIEGKIAEIERIEIKTQESAMRIINKTGPLTNYADRDHCLQYMVAVALLKGNLQEQYYLDEFVAANPEVDQLRDKMIVSENKTYSLEYLDAEKRAIGNAVQIFFQDGSATKQEALNYPLGHRRRREESIAYLIEKFEKGIAGKYETEQLAKLSKLWDISPEQLSQLNVDEFLALW